MAKRYKNDYFRDMIVLAKDCVDNLSLAEKHISNNKIDLKENNHSNSLHKIRLNLEKDYFTPLEREDIFSICCHLYEANESAMILCAVSREKDVILFSTELTALTQELKKLAETIEKIITELSKYPKHNDLTQLFVKSEIIYKEIRNKLHRKSTENNNYIISIMEKCAVSCHTTALHIQYVLIKNS